MRNFMVTAPGGDRQLLHRAETLAECESKLLIGYKVTAELVDGICVPPMPDGLKHYSFITNLLLQHGLELREWLADNGCVCKCGKQAKERDQVARETSSA